MKKLTLILIACVLQAACAGTGPRDPDPASLLSFEQISAEIVIHHELLDTEVPLASNRPPR